MSSREVSLNRWRTAYFTGCWSWSICDLLSHCRAGGRFLRPVKLVRLWFSGEVVVGGGRITL